MTDNTAFSAVEDLNPNGILIKFYRRLLSIPEKKDVSDFNYIVWGYFDWMTIESCKKSLIDLFIDHTLDYEVQKGYEEQILCVYPPQFQSFILNEPHHNKFPLIVITEVKIFDKEIQRLGLELIKKEIEDELAKIFARSSFQVVYSLGYSDLVIVFCVNSYEIVIDALIQLKNNQAIKSVYSIHGMHKDRLFSWDNTKADTASIFMSTKSNASFSEIIRRLENELNKTGINYLIEEYPLLGKYDLELRISPETNVGMSHIASLFLPKNNSTKDSDNSLDNILFSSNPFHRENINYTRTRWVSNYKPHEQQSFTKGHREEKNDITDGQFNRLWKIGHRLAENKSIQGHKYPHSLIIVLQDVLKYFWQIKNNETASPLLQNQLFKLITTLYKTMETDIEEDIQEIDIDCLELSIHLFSDLLQNWIQATRMVFEGPNYNLKFINSSTKIYISYFAIIEIIEQEIEALKKQNGINSSKLNFFPTINFTDLIKSHFLFPKSSYLEEKIIPIRFDKTSFFSPSKSLPWLLHEMGHYQQFGRVYERNLAFLRTMCADIARQLFIFTVVGNENSYLLDLNKEKWAPIATKCIPILEKIIFDEFFIHIDKLINEPFFDNFVEELSKVIRHVFGFVDVEMETLSNELDQALETMIAKGIIDEESYLMYSKLSDWLLDTIENGDEVEQLITFWQESKDFKLIQSNIFKIVQKIDNAYKMKQNWFTNLCGKIGSAIFESLYEGSNLNFFDKSTIEHPGLPNQIVEYANYFANQGLIEDTPKNRATVNKQIQNTIKTQNLSKEIYLYQDLFQETAADLFMIKILNLDKTQYDSIIDLAINRITSFYSSTETINQSILMRTRQEIIVTEYFKCQIDETNKDKTNNSNTIPMGFYDVCIRDYINCLELEFDHLLLNKDIQDLQNNFQKHIGVNQIGEVFSGEIKFIEFYWKKGLDLLDGKGA